MSRVVLDASVLLASAFEESMDDGIAEIIPGALISAVNLCEVFTKAEELGKRDSPKLQEIIALLGGVEPFTELQSKLAATLRNSTRKAGLSMGDRACLALALEMGATVYTADRAWATLDLDCEIVLIR